MFEYCKMKKKICEFAALEKGLVLCGIAKEGKVIVEVKNLNSDRLKNFEFLLACPSEKKFLKKYRRRYSSE